MDVPAFPDCQRRLGGRLTCFGVSQSPDRYNRTLSSSFSMLFLSRARKGAARLQSLLGRRILSKALSAYELRHLRSTLAVLSCIRKASLLDQKPLDSRRLRFRDARTKADPLP